MTGTPPHDGLLEINKLVGVAKVVNPYAFDRMFLETTPAWRDLAKNFSAEIYQIYLEDGDFWVQQERAVLEKEQQTHAAEPAPGRTAQTMAQNDDDDHSIAPPPPQRAYFHPPTSAGWNELFTDEAGHGLLVKKAVLTNPFARKKAFFFLTDQNYEAAPDSVPQYDKIPTAVRSVFDELRAYNQRGSCANGRGADLIKVVSQDVYHDAMEWAALNGHHLILDSMLMHLSIASQEMFSSQETLENTRQRMTYFLELNYGILRTAAHSTKAAENRSEDNGQDTKSQTADYLDILTLNYATTYKYHYSQDVHPRMPHDSTLMRLPLLYALFKMQPIDGQNLTEKLVNEGEFRTAQVLVKWQEMFQAHELPKRRSYAVVWGNDAQQPIMPVEERLKKLKDFPALHPRLDMTVVLESAVRNRATAAIDILLDDYQEPLGRVIASDALIANIIVLGHENLLAQIAKNIATAKDFSWPKIIQQLQTAVMPLKSRHLSHHPIMERTLQLLLLIHETIPNQGAHPVLQLAKDIEAAHQPYSPIQWTKCGGGIGPSIWKELSEKDKLTETELQAIKKGDLTPFFPLSRYDLTETSHLQYAIIRIMDAEKKHTDSTTRYIFWVNASNRDFLKSFIAAELSSQQDTSAQHQHAMSKCSGMVLEHLEQFTAEQLKDLLTVRYDSNHAGLPTYINQLMKAIDRETNTSQQQAFIARFIGLLNQPELLNHYLQIGTREVHWPNASSNNIIAGVISLFGAGSAIGLGIAIATIPGVNVIAAALFIGISGVLALGGVAYLASDVISALLNNRAVEQNIEKIQQRGTKLATSTLDEIEILALQPDSPRAGSDRSAERLPTPGRSVAEAKSNGAITDSTRKPSAEAVKGTPPESPTQVASSKGRSVTRKR